MLEVDRVMVDDFGIPILQMMDQAGQNLAFLANAAFFDDSPEGRSVLVAAGPGGNGGGGLSAARALHASGVRVSVVLSSPVDDLTHETSTYLKSSVDLGVTVLSQDDPNLMNHDLIIDAMLGYSLRGDPRGNAATLIERINDSGVPVLSNDIPSGIETTSGRVGTPAIKASATLTIALPKQGLAEPAARPLIGDLYLSDINVPPSLYERTFPEMGAVDPFKVGKVIRIW
jgi:NAD(P)H-hydrate epimerase